MDYQTTIKLSDTTQNHPTNFIITNKVEINDETCKTYNTNIEIRFDTSLLTLFRMWGAGGQKGPPTSFSPVICTNVIFGPQNILLFSLYKNSSFYIVPVQIIQLEPRPPLKKSDFFGQIYIKFRL